ncbi:hypothetical protein [Pseudorhodobacter sp.]|uniref:hypothetical protein n=1 Tax=Pseudorhodobacter sp. TaxID=1934400 RepID=UPI0026499055|nr:hypothetical protein [Pseudorhodobacter sp.]MDN5786782.1 hypothetical protein [Pseudorhodobacter sp.]
MTTTPPPIPTISVRQNEIPGLSAAYRINTYPVAVRSWRETEAGGFADPDKFPLTWTVYFMVDGQWAQLLSARGLRREWSSLDRLEKWLRALGFRYFWIRNDIEPADVIETASGLTLK